MFPHRDIYSAESQPPRSQVTLKTWSQGREATPGLLEGPGETAGPLRMAPARPTSWPCRPPGHPRVTPSSLVVTLLVLPAERTGQLQ